MNIIDLSLTIDSDCMTCGTPWHQKVFIERKGIIDEVGRNTSRIVLGSHTATHMDAPRHFIPHGSGIDEIDLNKCIGDVTCVDFRKIGRNQMVTLNDIRSLTVTRRMLFVFGWYKYWKSNCYYSEFPYFTTDAIEYLLSKGMIFMAMDTPSPDNGSSISTKEDSPNHKLLLARDAVIVEYLSNTELIDFNKKHEIIALPIKIKGLDGAPARVVVKEIE